MQDKIVPKGAYDGWQVAAESFGRPVAWRHSSGAMVCAGKRGGRWWFLAYGPLEQPELAHWQWLDGLRRPVTTREGQAVPMRREWLGRAETGAEARRLCVERVSVGADEGR